MTELLKITNLDVEFPTRRGRFQAVRGVNLTVKAGEVLGLVGESGAGKSTIGNAIIDLLEAPGQISGGSILFEGEELRGRSELEMRRLRGNRIGMIFQDPQTSLNPLMTVGAQLAETIEKTNDLRGSEVEGRAIELLEQVGITEAKARLSAYPHQFSGGMRQRIAIAIALLNDPVLILADEATTALDVTVQAQILHEMHRLCADEGTALIWVSHDLSVVSGIAASLVAGRDARESAIRTLAIIFIAIGLFSAVLTFVADLRGDGSEVTMAEATGEDLVEGEIAGQVARAEARGETGAVAVETAAKQPFWNVISLPFVVGLGIVLGGGLLSGGPAGRENAGLGSGGGS